MKEKKTYNSLNIKILLKCFFREGGVFLVGSANGVMEAIFYEEFKILSAVTL